MARVTSADVARAAGVSQSAVSRVFTPGASYSKETEAKVRAAAERLGYRPNRLARGLITGRSRLIGLVVASLDNLLYPVAVERLSRALQDEGLHCLIFIAGTDGADVPRVIGDLLDYQVDGIVTASVGMTDDLAARCEAAGIPVVMFNRGQDDPRLAEVTADNRAGGRLAAEFLIAGGHRRLAHVAGWQGASTGRDRAAGFAEALAAAGLAPWGVIDAGFDRAAAAAATRRLFVAPRRPDALLPDALFVGSDHMALAALDVLRGELGLSVPGDVSVVGFDDVPAAAWDAYRLTTIRQPIEAMVAETVATLIARIGGEPGPPRRIRLPVDLVIRTSAPIPEGWPR